MRVRVCVQYKYSRPKRGQRGRAGKVFEKTEFGRFTLSVIEGMKDENYNAAGLFETC